jgi:hypothetical protein
VHLRYPELAAGDMYKAFLMIEASLDYESPRGEKLRLSYGMLVLVDDPWKGDFSRD